jgi:uncharacterized protein
VSGAPESISIPASSRAPHRRRWLRWLLAVFAAYALVVALFAIFQRKLIYHPTQLSPAVAQAAARQTGFEEWRGPRGQPFGWKRASRLAQPWGRVLVMHGNAGWAIRRRDFTATLQSIAAVDVYLLEYPGFGSRPGEPTQNSLYAAASEGLLAMPTNLPVYVVGESLGSSPACYAAGTQPARVAGVLLIAPFANLATVAQRHYPWLPVRWLLRDPFPSAAYLRGYHGPLAVWLAGRDTVVPRQFGKELFSGYKGPRQLWEFPDAGHNTLSDRSVMDWEQVIDFWLRHRTSRGAAR